MSKFLKEKNTNKYSIIFVIAKYSLASILIAVPLYPKFPFLKVPGTFVSIRLEDLLILFSAILCFLIVLPDYKSILKNKLFQAMALFLVIGLISSFSAIFITKDVSTHLVMLHWLRRVEYFVPFFLAYCIFKRKNTKLSFYLNITIIVILIVFFYGFGQRYFGWPIVVTQNEEYAKGVALRWIEGSHINSTFAGHYDLASFLVLILPIVICGYYLVKGKISKFIFVLVFFSGLWLLVNSASRISLVSYLLSSTVALSVIRKFKAIPIIIFVSLIFMVFSTNLVSRYERILEVTLDKIKGYNLINYIENPVYAEESIVVEKRLVKITPTPPPVFEDRSTNIRLNVEWPRAIRATFKNPLFGTGYSSISLATDNDYLRLLGEVGILGLLSFALIFIRSSTVLINAYRRFTSFSILEKAYIGGYIGAVPGILLNATFIDVFEASKFAIIFWLISGMVLSRLSIKLNE